LKNGIINYYVILSDYSTDDCGYVIRGPSRPSSVSKILLEKDFYRLSQTPPRNYRSLFYSLGDSATEQHHALPASLR
jgi:hypothetical protein